MSRPNFAEESYLVAALERHAIVESINASDVLRLDKALFLAADRVHARFVHFGAQHYSVEPCNEQVAKLIVDWGEKALIKSSIR